MNGNNPSNLVTASWWNDFYNLLTGIMTDQVVSIKQNIELLALAPNPSAPTLALATGTTLGTGVYTYGITFITADGESALGTTASIVTTSGNQAVNLSAIPTGPTGVTGRKIYRTLVGGNIFYYVATIADNITTTHSDTTPDSTIASHANPPTQNTCGGSLIIKDANGNIKAIIGGDGSIMVKGASSLDSGAITTNGAGTLTTGQLYVTGNTNIGSAIVFTGNPSNAIDLPSGAYLGIKAGTTKIAEFKNNGNLVIEGSQYGTSAGTVGTASGQSFDSFDLSEVYNMAQAYPSATVVCLGDNDAFVQCTHDACPYAAVISDSPGFLMGVIDPANNVQAVALAGRVNVNTSATISKRALLCSDGQGGVRAMNSGESGFALGYALNDSLNGQVGMFIRPCTITAP
jgi:hypothetical protein